MRIEWSGRGGELLVHEGHRFSVRSPEPPHHARLQFREPTFDVRWRGAGLAVVRHVLQLRDERGVLTSETPLESDWRNDGPIIAARLSRGGTHVAVIRHRPTVHDETGKLRWQPSTWLHDGPVRGFALSDDGSRLAIGYVTNPLRGRGWMVIDVAKKGTVIDRAYVQMPSQGPGDFAFAFDRAGKRLVRAWPEPDLDGGAIRLGRGELYPRDRPGGARAVAMDDRGVIAVYAYPTTPPGLHGRLRVDFLDPTATKETPIEVVSTLSIDPELPNIAALAISPDRRAIACLAHDGRIEVLPVP